MSKNIHQVYVANPITSNTATDLMYFGQSPYGAGNDAAMLYSNFAAQFTLKVQTTKGDLIGFSTLPIRVGVGTTNGQVLQVNSAAASGISMVNGNFSIYCHRNRHHSPRKWNQLGGLNSDLCRYLPD